GGGGGGRGGGGRAGDGDRGWGGGGSAGNGGGGRVGPGTRRLRRWRRSKRSPPPSFWGVDVFVALRHEFVAAVPPSRHPRPPQSTPAAAPPPLTSLGVPVPAAVVCRRARALQLRYTQQPHGESRP